MAEAIHPNLAILMQLNLRDLAACQDVFADNFVWHYFNRELPELEGEYHGVDGLQSFFAKLGERSRGSFQVNVIDTRPAGDELVVSQVCNRMTLDENAFEFDAVVVWRIVDGRLSEAWDIPAINTIRTVKPGS